jgi:cytochrome c5
MKTMNPANQSLRLTFAALLAALLLGATASAVRADDAAPTATNAVVATAAPAVVTPPAHAGLTGAELYSMHCNRCHPERYPTERTAAQWKTIMLHMQVRANIPAKQSRLILQYLQENSGR